MTWQKLGEPDGRTITIPLTDGTLTHPAGLGTYTTALPYDGDNGPGLLSWIEPNHGTNFARFRGVGIFRMTVEATYTNSSPGAKLGIAIAGSVPFGENAAAPLAVTAAPTPISFTYDIDTGGIPGWARGLPVSGYYLGFVSIYTYAAGTVNVTDAQITVEFIAPVWVPIGEDVAWSTLEFRYHGDLAVGSGPPIILATDATLLGWGIRFGYANGTVTVRLMRGAIVLATATRTSGFTAAGTVLVPDLHAGDSIHMDCTAAGTSGADIYGTMTYLAA